MLVEREVEIFELASETRQREYVVLEIARESVPSRRPDSTERASYVRTKISIDDRVADITRIIRPQASREGGKGGKFTRAPRRLGGSAVAQKY